jgi:hypothetical protein
LRVGKSRDSQDSAKERSAEPSDDRRHVLVESERLPASQDRDCAAVVCCGCNQEGGRRHGDKASIRIVQKQETPDPLCA